MKFYWLILATLSVWRIAHLLQAEDGPWDIVITLRKAVGNGFYGKLMDCFYCLSLWISIPFSYALAENWREGLMLWLSLSAGAIILQRVTQGDNGHDQ